MIPSSEARSTGRGDGLAMPKLECPWVSWVDWPERQMGPGFWALGRREPDVYAQPAPPEWGSLPGRADGGEQAHLRGGEGNEPTKAALGSQQEQLNIDIGYQTPQSSGYQVMSHSGPKESFSCSWQLDCGEPRLPRLNLVLTLRVASSC